MYHILVRRSISQTRVLPVPLARHYISSPFLMQTTPQNPPGRGSGRGRGRGRGRGFFRRGAATAARTRPARAAPSPPIIDSPMPANGPEIVPSSTENTALSNVRFADFVARGRLSVDLAERILPFDFCTEVQAATFDNILDGRDV